ncbi:MAG: hypothetical protein DI524_21350, partial [Ectopseudomonas oleovorans]
MSLRLPLYASLLLLSLPAFAATQKVDLDYRVRFLPESNQAEVSITLEKGEYVRSLDFNLGEDGRFSDFQADGQWSQEVAGRGKWQPGEGKSVLSYRVLIDSERKPGRYDARMTDDWALFRGDDLIPAAKLDQQNKTELVARLQFELPKGWKSVETGWPRIGKNRFRIDNPQRKFDRPTGWMLAGKLGTRRTRLGDTESAISAPVGEG